jgi:DNA-binding LytR/AlgR family response regulator
MIKAIAIDDEPLALELISRFCSNHAGIQLEKTFTKPSVALAYLQKFPIDLVFLDIQMPSITGLELSKNLPENVSVIFTTAYSEYAIDAYELNAIDYLLKPFEESRFIKAVDKAVAYFRLKNQNENPADNFLFIRADYKLVKIPLADILYIEGLGDYLKVYYGADKLVVAANNFSKKSFSVVRYGNVWGSRGSIIPEILKQKRSAKVQDRSVQYRQQL